MNTPKEFIDRFHQRTREHIDRVIKNAKQIEKTKPGKFPGLIQQVKNHDNTKYEEPELTPNVWLTQHHYCKDNDMPFEYPEGMEEKVNKVTLHHIQNSAHHGEYHDPDKDKIKLGANRDELKKICDSTTMPDDDIAEMVCDWAAMSQELGDSLKGWADKNVNKRWKFTSEQVKLIYELVDILENNFEENLKRVLSSI